MIIFVVGFLIPGIAFYMGYRHGLNQLEYISWKRKQEEALEWQRAVNSIIEKKLR